MFIETFLESDLTFCDRLIDLWKTKQKNEGRLTVNRVIAIDKSKKESLDAVVDPDDPRLFEYFKILQNCANKYIEKYSYCNEQAPWRIIENVNIQYYPPGGGYKIWHSERGTNQYPKCGRHLVFMTYLNTIEGDGGTEWLYQNIKINAEKGKTVIWPADWTFTHRGIVSHDHEKYIITGWFNFIE